MPQHTKKLLDQGRACLTSLGGPCRNRCALALFPRCSRDRGLLQVSLAGAVVLVLANEGVRCQLFEPHLVIVVKAALVVVDEYAGRNVLRIYQVQCLPCGIPLSYHPGSRPLLR